MPLARWLVVMASLIIVELSSCYASAGSSLHSEFDSPHSYLEEELRCVNGGVLAEDRKACVCPMSYTGIECRERVCPHSIGGEGPFDILPVNPATKWCEHCQEELFTGINCQMCQKNSACHKYFGMESTCNKDFAIQGNEKQFQCDLEAPYFLNLMGDGRNISAYVVINWTTTDGAAFGTHDNGLSHFAIYRREPLDSFLDPFFRCDASACSSHLDEDTEAGQDAARGHHRFRGIIRAGGQWLLVALCFALAGLSLCTSLLGPKRMRKVTAAIASSLVALTVLYIFLMVVTIRPSRSSKKIAFECQHTRCSCAEDPPAEFHPICSQSDVLAKAVLPSIQNKIRFVCSAERKRCTLNLDDLNLVFNANCEASECVNATAFPVPSDEVSVDTRRLTILRVLVYMVTITVVCVGFHAVVLFFQSRRRREQFAVIFHLPTRRVGSPQTLWRRSEETGFGATEPVEPEPDDPEADRVPLLGSEAVIEVPPPLLQGEEEEELASVMEADEREAVEAVRRDCRSWLRMEVSQLRYTLPRSRFAEEGSEDRSILQNISFHAHSGDVVAIMGPSGAGKSTLLDLISVRGKSGVVEGEVRINGTAVMAPVHGTHHSTIQHQREYRHLIGYVSQEDALLPSLTVRQTITYAARLKLPSVFSPAVLHNIVSHTIQVLKLERCQDTRIGDGSSVRGISGGERRRVSIAVELLANPRILLLDEPTSGLDSVSAQSVMEAIATVAKDSPMRVYAPLYFAFQPIVIFSIHQPSVNIYRLFDKILLLSRGCSVYCGSAPDAVPLLLHRVNHAFGYNKCDPSAFQGGNPAEHLLQLEDEIDDDVRRQLQAYSDDGIEPAAIATTAAREGNPMTASTGGNEVVLPNPTSINSESDRLPCAVEGINLLSSTAMLRKFYANVYQQLDILISRSCACLLGSFHLIACHAGVVACLSLLICAVYKDQSLDLPGALNRAGCVTFLLLVTSFMSLSCLEALIVERRLFLEERENGFYATFPYVVSKMVVDILPFRAVPAMVLGAVIYFPMGFRAEEGWNFFYFIGIMVLFSVDITLVTMCIGIVSPSFGSAALLSSIVMLLNFVFGGAMVQAGTLSPLLQGIQRFSPFFLAFEALMVNELDGQTCTFSPTDETGHPSSASFTVQCRQYLANEGLNPSRWTEDVIQLCLYSVLFTFLAAFLMSYWTKLVR